MVQLSTPLLGVALTSTPGGTTTISTSANPTLQHPLGTRVAREDGGVYMYVRANGALAQYDCVAIDENYEAAPADSGTVDTNSFIGFAQVAFADNDFGWVAIEGTNINCNIITGTSADEALYADSRTSLAGQLQSLTSLGTLLLGVRSVAASNTSTSVSPEVSVQNVVPYLAT